MWLTQQKAGIIFLQETCSTKEVEDIWNTQYKGKSFLFTWNQSQLWGNDFNKRRSGI